MKEVLIHSAAELADCCRHLALCRRFGLDTEFVGEESYRPRLCLIQVATADTLYLIDPLAVENVEPFWKLVVDPANQVIVHAGREEVRLCHIWSGQAPGNLFDLQIAAGLVGLAYPLGHGALVAAVLGKRLDKRETLTEWRTRPLTDEQIRYAFDDVRFLLPLWEQLSQRLAKLGRDAWAKEEFARLCAVATPDDDGLSVSADKWRKLRGAGALDRRRLAILREVFYWREKAAANANRPARVMLRDDLIVEVARRNPKSVRDLLPVRGLAKRHVEAIFDAVELGRAIPSADCPAPAEREQDPPQLGLLVNLLAAHLAHWAAEQELASNLVATNHDLKMLVKARIGKTAPPEHSLLQSGWRAMNILPHLEAMLAGRVSLRVGDIQRDVPFEFREEG